MSFTMNDLLFNIGATLATLIWVILCLIYGGRYDNKLKRIDHLEKIEKSKFILSDLYFVGYGILETLNIRNNGNSARKKIKNMLVKYDKESEVIYEHMTAGKISLAILFTAISVLIGALTQNPVYMGLAFLVGLFLAFSVDMSISSDCKARRDEINSQLPNGVTKLLLFTSAGMNLPEALKKTAQSSKGAFYEELNKVNEDHETAGVPISDAMEDMAKRTNMQEIRKFCMVIQQAGSRGSSELYNQLNALNTECWETRKNIAKQKGAAASAKIIVPTMMMLIGFIIMIIVPIFTNL